MLAHRLGEWIANAPELEEDVALGNIGLDLLGHARSLLTYAGTAWDKSEDDLAYFRDETEFRCHQLFEQPNGDFAATIARQLIASVYFAELYRALVESTDATLAAIAAKARQGGRLPRRPQRAVAACGSGSAPSTRTSACSAACARCGRSSMSCSAPIRIAAGLRGRRRRPARGCAPAFDDDRCRALIVEAGLEVPEVSAGAGRRTRSGVHSEALGPMLAEMQVLARAHPGATW